MDRHGFYPFWFWNGDIQEEEIRWQIKEMAEQGIRGFFIHPRQGLQQPYLSQSFFDMVQVALAEAKSHGLVVHLYDEYPYPSGVAGGELVQSHPEFLATQLHHESRTCSGQIRLEYPAGKILSCQAFPIINAQPSWDEAIDLTDHVGMHLSEESYNEGGLTPYNQKRYFCSSPRPTLQVNLDGEHLVACTIQVVVENHKYWGNFTDTLNPEAVKTFLRMTHKRYQQRLGDSFGSLIRSIFVDETCPSWSPRVPAAFSERYGYDLVAHLPALHLSEHPEHECVSLDLKRLLYRMFEDAFDSTLSAWCSKHNIKWSGEKPAWRLSQMRHMAIPGCEPGHTKAGAPNDFLRCNARSNARATYSAAYHYKHDESLCECFHSMGWSGTLQDIKLISEGLLQMGIRYLVPHGFFYTTHSLAKHDAPPSFFFQMPYWPFFKHLSSRINRIAECLDGAHIDAKVAILEPGSSFPNQQEQTAYTDMQAELIARHIDFVMVDTDLLQQAEAIDGVLRMRDLGIATLLIPPMRNMEPELEEVLCQIQEAGVALAYSTDTLDVQPSIALYSENGMAEEVSMSTWANGNGKQWFLINASDHQVELRIDATQDLEEIPLDDLPPRLTTGKDGYTRTLQPFESIMLRPGKCLDQPIRVMPLSLPLQMQVTPRNANSLRLGDWKMSLNGQTAKVPAIPIANQLADSGLMFAPDFAFGFGVGPKLRYPEFTPTYRSTFSCDYTGDVRLVMEPNTFKGDWQLLLNGQAIRKEDFEPTPHHIRGSQAVDVMPLLKQGENTLEARVTTDRPDGGMRNPLYLYGDFRVNRNTLTERLTTGAFDDWTGNGLPYFAGICEYECKVELDNPSGYDLAEMAFPVPFQDMVEVSVNGGEWTPLCWSPYLIPTEGLRGGMNAIKLRVYTSLIRAFEGQYFDIPTHQTLGIC